MSDARSEAPDERSPIKTTKSGFVLSSNALTARTEYALLSGDASTSVRNSPSSESVLSSTAELSSCDSEL